MKAGLAAHEVRDPRFAPISRLAASSALSADADQVGVALCRELACDAGADAAAGEALADRLLVPANTLALPLS